jgi:uncharacterized membrane protein YhaH (DUF805 family)
MEALRWFIDPVTKQYADFNGRTTRQEFWMYVLIYIIAYIVVGVVSDMLAFLLGLGLLVPNIAITARRLHDVGKSGWWQLIALIPLVGAIILIVWCAGETGKEANTYGAPRTAGTAPTPVAQSNMVDAPAASDTNPTA